MLLVFKGLWNDGTSASRYREIMLRNKSNFQISTPICLSSISICNLLIDLPSYDFSDHRWFSKKTLCFSAWAKEKPSSSGISVAHWKYWMMTRMKKYVNLRPLKLAKYWIESVKWWIGWKDRVIVITSIFLDLQNIEMYVMKKHHQL
jgi:hypothetical protein